MAEREVDRSVSQTVKAQLALRDQILSGALRPGERISELQAVETTGASRTPSTIGIALLDGHTPHAVTSVDRPPHNLSNISRATPASRPIGIAHHLLLCCAPLAPL